MKRRIFNRDFVILLAGLFVVLAGIVQAQVNTGVRVACADIGGDNIVHTPKGDYLADFQIEAQVFFTNGAASGYLNLIPRGSASPHPGGVNMVFCDGSVRFLSDGRVEQVLLRGRTMEAEPMPVLLVIANQDYYGRGDRLVYTLTGPGIYATWQAQGRFELISR